MYTQTPWTLNSSQKSKNRKTVVSNPVTSKSKFLNFLKENTSLTFSANSLVKELRISKLQAFELIKDLRNSKNIKLVDVERKKNCIYAGIYQYKKGNLPELDIEKSKSYTSIANFLIKKHIKNPYCNPKLRASLVSLGIDSKIALTKNNRLVDVYSIADLNRAFDNLRSNSKRFGKKVVKAKVKKVVKAKATKNNVTKIQKDILTFLNKNPYSLKSRFQIAEALKKNWTEINPDLMKLVDNKVLKVAQEEDRAFSEDYKLFVYQVASSPIWTANLENIILKGDNYVSLTDFSKKFLLKNSISIFRMNTIVRKEKLHSLQNVSTNGKPVETYDIGSLKLLFNNYLKKSKITVKKPRTNIKKCKEVVEATSQVIKNKPCFKFKLFGKEISINII